jgi:hypothetical protein
MHQPITSTACMCVCFVCVCLCALACKCVCVSVHIKCSPSTIPWQPGWRQRVPYLTPESSEGEQESEVHSGHLWGGEGPAWSSSSVLYADQSNSDRMVITVEMFKWKEIVCTLIGQVLMKMLDISNITNVNFTSVCRGCIRPNVSSLFA